MREAEPVEPHALSLERGAGLRRLSPQGGQEGADGSALGEGEVLRGELKPDARCPHLQPGAQRPDQALERELRLQCGGATPFQPQVPRGLRRQALEFIFWRRKLDG
eukprot:scaffold4316_cov116-Isochrysis_galbana.AAC.6